MDGLILKLSQFKKILLRENYMDISRKTSKSKILAMK